jgi:hypothetical protein
MELGVHAGQLAWMWRLMELHHIQANIKFPK